MKIGIVFAGQGAQYPGMGKDLYDHAPKARAVFDEAGDKIKDWCFNGTKETLRQTHITQPCVYATTMAAYRALMEALNEEKLYCGMPDEGTGEDSPVSILGMAGFSLGEYAALTAAGAITDLDKGLDIVTLRGQFMEEAGLDEEGNPRGGMVAAFGDTERIEMAVAEAANGRILEAVNYNNPRQTVVAGETAALADFEDMAANYRLKTKRLSVSTAFHCAMMEPAAKRLLPELMKIDFRRPSVRVYSNVTALDIMEFHKEEPVGEYLAKIMAKQVESPVHFMQVIRYMMKDGADAIVEVGPGDTLSGFVRKIDRNFPVSHVEDMESLEHTVSMLKEGKC